MVELIHPPDPQSLLPPLLACLPTAFASPRPPPALLSLLSPILRQRLSYISSSDNWLKLLCWDPNLAETLWEHVENATFEPHPSSGEIEVGDLDSITYKRFDEETLKAQLSLSEWSFNPVYLWCTGSQESDAWKLAELLPEPKIDETWSQSISHANETAKERMMAEAIREAELASSQQQQSQLPRQSNSALSVPKEEDDYWAQYDQTPGRTPARKSSIPLQQHPSNEADYYSRYGDVQPAMDAHDPDEEVPNGSGIESTLNGGQHAHAQDLQARLSKQLSSTADHEADEVNQTPPPYLTPTTHSTRSHSQSHPENPDDLAQPAPSSPSSRHGSDTVARLEDAAERYNNGSHSQPIKTHIAESVKSLSALAKSAGVGREEFREIVGRALDEEG